MFVVIFRARIKALDADYIETAALLRDLALRDYGCLEFKSVTERAEEITLSYWSDLAAIKAWKGQAEHLLAQNRGQARWYESYRVEIAEISRAYEWPKAQR